MKIERDKFLEALKKAKPGLSAKDIIEQASCYVFSGDRIYTFNDEVAVAAFLEHGITGAVPAKKLFDLIDKMTDAVVDVETSEEGLLIKGKKLKAVIKYQTQINLPISELSKPVTWHALPAEFVEGMSNALMSTGTDLTKPVLTCVHWTPEHIESCDNFRLTRHILKVEGLEENVLIPANSVRQLISYKAVEFSITAGWAHFKTADDCVFSCRVFAGEYSNIDKFFKMPDSATVIVFPKAIYNVFSRISVLASSDVTGAAFANIQIKDKKLTVFGNSDQGSIMEETPINNTADIMFAVKVETFAKIGTFEEGIVSESGTSIRFSKDNHTHIVSLMQPH